jgi:hypothetical protein
MESIAASAITTQIVDFIRSIGIEVQYQSITEDTIMPGVTVNRGAVVLDPERLLYPGDLLHEAGHIAVVIPADRQDLHGNIDVNRRDRVAEELMAIAWSYAAAIHLGIDPHIVFHANGYKGDGAHIVENFNAGRYMAVETLQWAGMTVAPRQAAQLGVEPYPKMTKWMREAIIYAEEEVK